MSGPFKRRPSLKALPNVGLIKTLETKRRQSAVSLKPVTVSQQEVPWDVLDRCFLPVVFCHAAAIILSSVLNALHISQVSTLTLFIFFAITTIAAVLFYHNLKVGVLSGLKTESLRYNFLISSFLSKQTYLQKLLSAKCFFYKYFKTVKNIYIQVLNIRIL